MKRARHVHNCRSRRTGHPVQGTGTQLSLWLKLSKRERDEPMNREPCSSQVFFIPRHNPVTTETLLGIFLQLKSRSPFSTRTRSESSPGSLSSALGLALNQTTINKQQSWGEHPPWWNNRYRNYLPTRVGTISSAARTSQENLPLPWAPSIDPSSITRAAPFAHLHPRVVVSAQFSENMFGKHCWAPETHWFNRGWSMTPIHVLERSS